MKIFNRNLCIVLLIVFVISIRTEAQIIFTKENRPESPALSELPLSDTLSQYGITWKFDKKVQIGKFVTGDFYVVGPFTVISINHAPGNGRNGSMLNGLTKYQSGYDSRSIGYSEKVTVKPPVNMKP